MSRGSPTAHPAPPDRVETLTRPVPPGLRGDLCPVRAVMTTVLAVATPSWTLLAAVRAMRQNRVSGLPVVDGEGRLVGVISERDLLWDLDRAVGIGHVRGFLDLLLELEGSSTATRLENCLRRLEGGHVGEVMATPAVAIGPETTVAEASRILRHRRFKRLPVVENGHLVGLVTQANLWDAYAAGGDA